MSKFIECDDCYYQHREPAICEQCDEASEFEPKERADDSEGRVVTKPVRVFRRRKAA